MQAARRSVVAKMRMEKCPRHGKITAPARLKILACREIFSLSHFIENLQANLKFCDPISSLSEICSCLQEKSQILVPQKIATRYLQTFNPGRLRVFNNY